MRATYAYLIICLLAVTACAGRWIYYPTNPVDAWAVCATTQRCSNAEDWTFDNQTWEVVADATADGGNYLHMRAGQPDFATQIASQMDATCDFLWLRARGNGVVWLSKTPFGHVPSNTTASILFAGNRVTDWTWSAIGTRADENLQRIALGASRPSNDTAQRDVDLTAGQNLYVLTQPTVDLDSWFCSTDPNATPVSPGGGTSQPANYALYEVTSEPTIDAAAWDSANVVAKTGAVGSGPLAADMVISAVWRNATPDRICVRGEETLANQLFTTTTEDDTTIGSNQAVLAYFRLAANSLDRLLDENAWLLGLSPQPQNYTASWPNGVFTTATDLTNLTMSQSTSGNRRRMQACFDSPAAIATGSRWLCDFRQNERITGGPLRSKHAFNATGTVSDVTQWGICEAGPALPTPPVDSTPPIMGSVAFSNVTTNSFTATASATDAESGISLCQAVYLQGTTGTPTVGTDTTVNGTYSGGNCVVNLSGLASSTTYRVAVRATNGAGLAAQSTPANQATSAGGATFYIATNGSPTANCNSTGTACNLSRLMATTEPRPSPGETWILRDGTYPVSSNSPLTINCATNGNAVNGTQAQPITLRAENSRQAWIKSNGTTAGLKLLNCSWWVIDGLRVSNADNGAYTSENHIVYTLNGNRVTYRNLLMHHSNRCGNFAGFHFDQTAFSTVETSELYYYHRNGFVMSESSDNVVRRNYANSRFYVDARTAGCDYISSTSVPGRGDESFSAYPGNRNVFENNIAENNGQGYLAHARSVAGAISNKFLGNIDINMQINGFTTDARGNNLAQMPQDNLVENHLSLNSGSHALRSLSGKGTIFRNVSAINSGLSGIIATNIAQKGDGQYSVDIENALSLNNPNAGVDIVSPPIGTTMTWGVDNTSSFGNQTAYAGLSNGSNNTNRITANPNLGNCLVWIPAASPLSPAGAGANIIFAYVNGIQGSTKLWNSSTGKWAFAGATASGANPSFSSTQLVTDADLNTVAGANAQGSASDVHTRLNITAPNCLPGGY